MVVYLPQIKGEGYRVFERRTRVGGHQIRHEILLHIELLVYFIELVVKLFVHAERRLAHIFENAVGAMFGGDF